ncbi:NADH-quinone oxidoreductase subunit C [Selenomonadales bacterium OttesenSCG-928-I06]|nr:NADH-quinone oxidoreductase subunit C [Selenomonadales bacterium OttesenSCG-928-I06]
MELTREHFILLLIQKIGNKAVSIDKSNQLNTVLKVNKYNLLEVCLFLEKEQGGRLFTMVGTDERKVTGYFSLYYVFAFDKYQVFMTVKIDIDEAEPTFPSVSAELPAANWYEREVNDLLGLRALGHPDRRPLVLHGDWPEDVYPLRKDYDAKQMAPRVENRESYMEYEGKEVVQIPVGPIHAGIIEPGHFRFGVVGDTVLHLDARLFFTHRGIEKIAEGMSLDKALLLAERVCGVCAMSHAVSFAQAVEDAANIDIPERAKYLRMVLLELERIYNHVGDVGNICAGFGFAVGISHGSRLKEQLLRLNEHITGNRYLRGIIALGGLHRDISSDDLKLILETLDEVAKSFDELTEILLSHDIAVDRMATTGVLSLKQAEDLEVVGVAARASGRNVDCRKSHPYALYDKVKFNVVCDEHGDVLARANIRIEEIKESMGIVKQAIANLVEGEVCTKVGMIRPYTIGIGWTESARGENCHWLMIGPDNKVFRYRVRSATYNNWPAVALAVPGNIVPDFPVINKSFELCYACCDR